MVLDVLLQELCAKLKVLNTVVIGHECVEIGDEVLALELHLIIKVDLRKDLYVGVQVEGRVSQGGLEEELHQVGVLVEVSCALEEVVRGQTRRGQAELLEPGVELRCVLV